MQRNISQLFSEGESLLLRINQCERKIECKRIAESENKEARFYPNPYSPVCILLTEPVSTYEAELENLNQEKAQISAQLKDNLNATDHRAHSFRKSQ